jgi:hypothetical protein
LMVRFRKSSNARRIAGMSQCVGYGVIPRRTRRKMLPVRRGVTVRRKRVKREGCRSAEGSDFEGEYKKMAAVRRGVTLRRRKVARMRRRVTRRCGMRYRKPCRRWSMKSLTRLPRPIYCRGRSMRKVSSVATLFGIIPSVSAVLGCVSNLCLLMSMCTTASIFGGRYSIVGGLR